jgi:hypothetical protein
MKIRSVVTLVGLAISFALPTFAQQKESTPSQPSQSTPEATPTSTLGDRYTRFYPTDASPFGFQRQRPTT